MKSLLISILALVCFSSVSHAIMTTDQAYLLDKKMGPVAFSVKLGTLLKSIESVTNGVLADGTIFVGDALGTAVAVTPSGDITMTNAGVTAIGAKKVTKAILAATLQPSHVVKFAGSSTAEVDADAEIVITVTGALSTDVASVVLRAATNAVYVTKAVLSADTLTVTLSGNGGAGSIVDYSVLRAAP